MFQTFTIGRSTKCDICFEDDSVSRRHMELTVTDAGKLYAIDCHSSHGSFIRQGQEWERFTQGYLQQSDALMLGKFVVQVDLLVKRLPEQTREQQEKRHFEPLSVKPRRNVATGEIQRKP